MNEFNSEVVVVGCGFVGLSLCVALATERVKVLGYDSSKDLVHSLNNKDITFFEPGIKERLSESVAKGRLSFTSDLTEDDLRQADAVVICTGVQTNGVDSFEQTDNYIEQIKDIAPKMKKSSWLIIKSTVFFGTMRLIEEKVEALGINLAYCPEFLREGKALEDALNPERLVIGLSNPNSDCGWLKDLLSFNSNPTVVRCSFEDAEMIKVASNACLAMRVSFANEIARLCEATKSNSYVVLKTVGLDRRIGQHYLDPGPGWGGSCFPKDVEFAEHLGKIKRVRIPLIDSIKATNQEQFEFIYKLVNTELGENTFPGETIAIWGLTFKSNTSDIRLSPAVLVVRLLLKHGFNIRVYDPMADIVNHRLLEQYIKGYEDNFKLFTDPFECVNNSELLLVLTEWPEFKQIDLSKVRPLLNRPTIIDTRNVIEGNPSLNDSIKLINFDFSR